MALTETEAETIHNSIISVDELQNYGINASDLQKLKASGIFSVNVCWVLDVVYTEEAKH